MFNIPNLPICCIIVELKISFKNSTDYSSEAPLSVYVCFETSDYISENSIIDDFLVLLNKRINSLLFFDGVNILLEEPHEYYFDFLIDHFIDSLNSLSKLPILESVFHEFEEIF